MENKKIADIFNEIADMMELDGTSNIFEIRAYRNAALNIEFLQEDIKEIYKKGGIEGLNQIPGVGKSIAERIKEFIETGKIKKYEDFKKKYPFDIGGLTKVPGLGPKRALKLYQNLGVKDMNGLKKAVEQHKISTLETFGEKSESEIAKGIAMLESGGGRMALGRALPEAELIIKKIVESGLVERADLAGSSRRMKETVGDLDILLITKDPEKMTEFISKMDETEHVLLKGPTKVTVRLKIGLNCDFRMLTKESFGAAMQYFIGNKNHNVKVRQIAISKGYKLNEYGLFDKKGKSVAGEDEREVYEKLGLQYMEPEMREDRGEVELAAQHKIPRLVQIEDIKGDLHVHTTFSDGVNSMEDMVKEAIRLNREYVGFTDHSKSEYAAKGMDDKKFEKYTNEIESLRKKYGSKIKILKSSETDILKDGSLDWSRKALESMDYVTASIHTNLNMPRDEMTKRAIKCMESGMVDIMAHPTDRLINQRPPINMDLDKVFEAAKENNVIMEIDAYPDRLDLNDENILRARKFGIKFSIDTDSHRTTHMQFMRYGVSMAKRGWLEKGDVINTSSAKEIMQHFKKK